MQKIPFGKMVSLIAIAAISITPNTAVYASIFGHGEYVPANGANDNIAAHESDAANQPAQRSQTARQDAGVDDAKSKKETKRVRGRINRAGHPGQGAGPRPKKPWTVEGKRLAKQDRADKCKTKRVKGRINRAGRPGNGAGPRPQKRWVNSAEQCK